MSVDIRWQMIDIQQLGNSVFLFLYLAVKRAVKFLAKSLINARRKKKSRHFWIDGLKIMEGFEMKRKLKITCVSDNWVSSHSDDYFINVVRSELKDKKVGESLYLCDFEPVSEDECSLLINQTSNEIAEMVQKLEKENSKLQAEIDRLKKESGWIPVINRLPCDEFYKETTTNAGDNIFASYVIGRGWLDLNGGAVKITHWRERLEPYQPPEPENKNDSLNIVSGENSKPFWNNINSLKDTNEDVWNVVYHIGCKMQELESVIKQALNCFRKGGEK